MNEDRTKRDSVLAALRQALEQWTSHGNEQPLTRWLDRELDGHGALLRLPIGDWQVCLQSLLEARSRRGAWPARWNEPIARLLRTTFWFARADGTPATDFDKREVSKPMVSTSLHHSSNGKAGASPGPSVADGIATQPGDGTRQAIDTWSGSDRALAVLRPGWPVGSDFLAIDHRDAQLPCRFELFGAGRSWLGPSWVIDGAGAMSSSPKPRSWIADSSCCLAEWSYRAGGVLITQSAVVLGGRSLALLSIHFNSRSALPATCGMNISLPPRIAAKPIGGSRGLVLTALKQPGSAQVLPIGLPCLPYPSDRGSFRAADQSLLLRQAAGDRRSWLPLLVSWDWRRHRKEVHWRALTVSEKSRYVRPHRAFAVRISWGRDETFVIYRSFTPPVSRAFLGHQTTARFLVGSFKPDGTVEPILKVE